MCIRDRYRDGYSVGMEWASQGDVADKMQISDEDGIRVLPVSYTHLMVAASALTACGSKAEETTAAAEETVEAEETEAVEEDVYKRQSLTRIFM